MAKSVKTTGKTLSPWGDVGTILINAKSLTIKAGGKSYSGAMVISSDDRNGVTIDVGGKAPSKKKAAKKAKK